MTNLLNESHGFYSLGKHYFTQRPNVALCRQFKTRHPVKNYILRVILK